MKQNKTQQIKNKGQQVENKRKKNYFATLFIFSQMLREANPSNLHKYTQLSLESSVHVLLKTKLKV